MIEKRFMVSINESTNEREFWDYDRHLDCCEVVDLLNNYSEGYESLKKSYSKVIDENHRLRLVKIHADDLHRDVEWLKENLGEGLEHVAYDPYNIIHTGNPREFVIKNVNEPETYEVFYGDEYDQKSMKEFIEKVNRIVKENGSLKQHIQCHKERISMLSELLDLADAIIDLSDDEKAKETWENKNAKFEIKWKKVTDNVGDLDD